MQSTLSTGLNKNEEYIKENCINTYVRQVTFKNNEKVHLNEDTAIPASEIPVRRYVRCNSLLYPTDIQICNFNLRFTIVRESPSSCDDLYCSSSILITQTEVNNNGLLTVVQSKLSTLNVQLVNTFDENTYSGCRLHIQQQQDARVKMLSCNYAFAWMMGIISSFKGNSPDAMLVLKNASSNIDTISDPSQIDNKKHIISKQFFPLINGGINIINVSSDELVTSQYVNGFKTTTLASIPANDLKVSTHSLINFSLPTKNNTKLRAIRAFIMLRKHANSTGDDPGQGDGDSQPINYITTDFPSCISSFNCTSHDQQYFDLVVIRKQSQQIQSFPHDIMDSTRVGEIRINARLLQNISSMWLLRVKYFGTVRNDTHRLVIVKMNVFFIDNSGNRFDELLHMNTNVCPHADKLRDAVVNEECVQFIDITNSPAQYICIRPFCFQRYGLGNNATYCRLSLEPLEGNPLQINLLTKKFSNIRSGAVTINSPRTLGKHKIPLDTSSINQPIISENNSTSKYKVLDYLESPWIECSTTGHVGHVQLHIQDEYLYDIKQRSSTDGFEFQAELQFADVPK